MQRFSTYVGLDVHKNSIQVAFATADGASPQDLKRLPNDLTRLWRTLALLGAPHELQVCYEAGPTGYGLGAGCGSAATTARSLPQPRLRR